MFKFANCDQKHVRQDSVRRDAKDSRNKRFVGSLSRPEERMNINVEGAAFLQHMYKHKSKIDIHGTNSSSPQVPSFDLVNFVLRFGTTPSSTKSTPVGSITPSAKL